jgi:hypothetical protein
VFDFKEEDELPELTSGKFLGKLKNSNLDNHAMLKYEFLECGNVPSISVFFFFFFLSIPRNQMELLILIFDFLIYFVKLCTV